MDIKRLMVAVAMSAMVLLGFQYLVPHPDHKAATQPALGAGQDTPAAAPGADAARSGSSVIYGGAAGPGLLTALGDAVDGVFLGRFAHDPYALVSVLDEASALALRLASLAQEPENAGDSA